MEENQRSVERKGNLVVVKSFTFAVKVIEFCRQLSRQNVEFTLTRQLLRSGTSIGANVEEAIGGHPRAEFASKMGIAYKKAREYAYWIRLLEATNTITPLQTKLLLTDIEELLRIIGSIRMSLKKKAIPAKG